MSVYNVNYYTRSQVENLDDIASGASSVITAFTICAEKHVYLRHYNTHYTGVDRHRYKNIIPTSFRKSPARSVRKDNSFFPLYNTIGGRIILRYTAGIINTFTPRNIIIVIIIIYDVSITCNWKTKRV